jgi:hypothetical protein
MCSTPLANRQAPRREEHLLPLENESVQDSPSAQDAPSDRPKLLFVRCQDCPHYKNKNKPHIHKCPGAKSSVVAENNPIGGDNEQVEHQ